MNTETMCTPFYPMLQCNRLLLCACVVFQDYLGACIVLAAGVCSITAGILGHISPSVVGLAVAYAIIVRLQDWLPCD